MAGLRMSFMDALRVAAQTKDAPKEWGHGDQKNASSWPAALSDPVRSPAQKRRREDDAGMARTQSLSSNPSRLVHQHSDAFACNALPSSACSVPSSPAGRPRSHFLPRSGMEAGLASPSKLQTTPQRGGSSNQGTPSNNQTTPSNNQTTPSNNQTTPSKFPLSASAPCPSSAPPASKRRKPFDLGWISAVASSIRGPWTGQRSAADDAVTSHVLTRTLSVPGGASGGLAGQPGGHGGAMTAKLKENVLQQVFDRRQAIQSNLSSLPEIMQWGSDLLDSASHQAQHVHRALTPECSESSGGGGGGGGSLKRCATDPARMHPSPATSQTGGTPLGGPPPPSSLVSAEAIQRCLMAAPPHRRSHPAVSSSVSSAAPPQRTPAGSSTSSSPLESLLSSGALAKCLAAAPPRAPTSVHRPDQGVPPHFGAPRSAPHSYHSYPQEILPRVTSDVASSAAAQQNQQQDGSSSPAVKVELELKTVASLEEIVSGSWNPPTAGKTGWVKVEEQEQEGHEAVDDYLREPSGEIGRPVGTAGGVGVSREEEEEDEVASLAAACMDTLTQLVHSNGQGAASQINNGPAAHNNSNSNNLGGPSHSRPTPLLVDAEAIASFCPDALADICGVLAKSPNAADGNNFNWDAGLPTPNAGIGEGVEALWDAAWDDGLKAELPSPKLW